MFVHAVDFYNIKVSFVTHGIVLIKGERTYFDWISFEENTCWDNINNKFCFLASRATKLNFTNITCKHLRNFILKNINSLGLSIFSFREYLVMSGRDLVQVD